MDSALSSWEETQYKNVEKRINIAHCANQYSTWALLAAEMRRSKKQKLG